jgi:hypothetical protein
MRSKFEMDCHLFINHKEFNAEERYLFLKFLEHTKLIDGILVQNGINKKVQYKRISIECVLTIHEYNSIKKCVEDLIMSLSVRKQEKECVVNLFDKGFGEKIRTHFEKKFYIIIKPKL